MSASLDSFLCDVSEIRVPHQQSYQESLFPYVLKCTSAESTLANVMAWVSAQREELLELATRHGAILFRELPLTTAEDFDGFIQAFDLPNFPYRKSLSNAVRVNRTERVFTANEAPRDVRIFFHHEMAQTPIYPRWILFFCECAAEEGGATPLCRSDILYEQLAEACPQFVRNCEVKGLCYTNVMPGEDDAQSGLGRSWQGTLGVQSKEAAERRLRELNYRWEWLPDGSLKATTPPLPAVMEVAAGRKAFFNQLIAAFCGWKDSRNDPSNAVRYGDGSKLDSNAVARAVQLSEELAYDLDWQRGDAVLIDNTVAMHGRRTFRGTRKILASLVEAREQSFVLVEQSG